MKNFVILFILIIGLFLVQSCKKDSDDDDSDNPLKVVTNQVSDITSSSAILHGEITQGSLIELEKGFVYGRFENPDFTNTVVPVAGAKLGEYSYEVTGLPNNTQYYVKAYAINNKDTVLGAQVDFKTNL
jgi:nucleoside recognition membrane protein YjiH